MAEMSEKVADTDIAMEEIQGDGKRLTAAEIPIATTRTSDPPTDTSIMADSAPDEVESNAWAGLLKFFSTIFIIHFFPFSLLCSLKTAQEYERAVIFACGESYMAAQKDQILTEDYLTVTVDAVMYFRVIDPVLSVTHVEDFIGASKMLGATPLRNILG
ncbi:UNC1-like protein, partial [Mya arenaria]